MDLDLNSHSGLVAGVDEAGRGPLAGPVVAAAVILDPLKSIDGLRDSKKLSEKKREKLFELICDKALCYAIGHATVGEIDSINILQASLLAMTRAVESLSTRPELVLIDGNKCPDLSLPCRAIVGGDDLIEAISAASILAKVTRDKEMLSMDTLYPQYGFARHKGYPTKLHLEALKIHGASREHRVSFAPVQRVLNEKRDTR